MISRSNTITNDRLRRSRSATSMQAASSRQRTSAPPDPFVVRRQAEAAASQAYKRALPVEQTPAYLDYRPAPPMLQRRRSQISGRSEGSHLEDARLGRRRSTVRRDESKITPSARLQSRPGPRPPPLRENETSSRAPAIARPTSEVKAAHRKERLLSAAHPYQRRPPSAIRSGSPPTRTPSVISGHRASSLAPTPRHTEKSYDEGISVTYTEPHSYSDRARMDPTPHSRRVSIRETQTDDEIIALARERGLEDFQRPKIRERKSFFGSFQKLQRRDATDKPLHNGIQYDNSLPPFNYAEDSLIAPLPPAHDVAAPSVVVTTRPERKTGMFSGSVKGRFKKLLRKASMMPGALPSHHLGEDLLQPSRLGEVPPESRPPTNLHDPFVVDEPLAPPRLNFEAGFPTISNASNASLSGESAADKSRVTSWTTSTAAGTASTRTNTASTSVADEHGRLPKTKSRSSTLRKKSSFFGRAVQNRLRKSSRADLKGSEDSQALFTALQERIQPREQVQEGGTPRAVSAASEVSRASSDFSTLPSRVRADSLASSGHGRTLTTIRTVSPDPDAYKMQTMSTVVETSPDRLESNGNAADGTPTANHGKSKRRAAAIQAAPLSPDRIARRVQQSQTRWQGTLHSTASAADRKIVSAYDEDNPYELPSLGRTPHFELSKDTGGLPHHAKLCLNADASREKLLSPSVYSRATDGASPRPATPDEGGSMVTVTSREVKRYEISPKKDAHAAAQRPIQASNEWRQWFSNEMNGLAGPEDVRDLSLSSQRESTATFNPTSRDQAGSDSQGKRSGTPASDQASRTRRESRPRASSRRSSYMNDRYPMFDSADGASRHSNRTSRKYSMASNAGTDSERPLQTSGGEDDKYKVRRNRAFSGSSRLSKSHSIAHIETTLAQTPDLAAPDSIIMSGAIPNEVPAEKATSHKHKSAFDLRAKYKSKNSSASRPVEVRRKPIAPIAILEDNTILNISAGPYAASSTKTPASVGSHANKENTPPHNADDGNLPALSSSEWLAGPPGKKRPETVRAKSSPPKAMSFAGSGKEGSPGQRLVTGWLEGRKGKGGDEAAFV